MKTDEDSIRPSARRGLGKHGSRLACTILVGVAMFSWHFWWWFSEESTPKALGGTTMETKQIQSPSKTAATTGFSTSKLDKSLESIAGFKKTTSEPTPLPHLRPRPLNGSCASLFHKPTLPTTIDELMRAPGLNLPQFSAPIKVQFDESTWTYSDGPLAITLKLKKRNFFGSSCPAKCEVVQSKGDALVFNQFTTDYKKKVRNGTMSVVYSGEILGQMWRKHVSKGVGLRMSSSMLANETDIAMPWGCAFVKEYCVKNRCPPDFASRIAKRPLLPGGEKIKGLVVSIIRNGVQPRARVLKNLMQQLSTSERPGADNYGNLHLNRKSSALSGRDGYADGSKVNIFRSYPFAFVPENSWSHVKGSGYVTEKAYDAYMAGSLPIWEGTLSSTHLPLYFPPAAKRNQTLLRVKDYPGWQNASGLAAHIRYLTSHPEAYAEYFDWDKEWFRSGPLRKACHDGRWCKMCVALHVMRQGFCPPFM